MNEPLFYVLWIVLIALLWLRKRSNLGRRFSTEIADSLDIDRDFFHTILETGLKDDAPNRVLADLKKRKMTAGDAAIELAPVLAQGLVELEENDDLQAVTAKAKPQINALLVQWSETHGKPPSVAAVLTAQR